MATQLLPQRSQFPLPSDADRSGRDLGSEELALLREVIESGTLNCTKGTQVKAFEESFAHRYGVPYARAVSSGTAAIHAAVAAIDPEPGDEIITSPITDMGAIAPILYQQAIPIFADVEPVTLNVTPATVAERITPRTRAIIATHLFGNPCDVTGIKQVAEARGIPVIEDCAQAYLATQHGRLAGTIGAIGAFSLQQGKHMTTGEGGVVITSSAADARLMSLFTDKAWGYGDPQPDHYFLALNYRMTDLQGAVARAQLGKLDGVVARRQRTAALLTKLLADVPGLTLPTALPGATHVYWKYSLIVDPAVIRGGADALGAELKAGGVFCTPRYIQKPAFLCQVFTEQKTYGLSRCPFSCPKRADGTKNIYQPADYPGVMRGLERVVVLPWNEFYTDEHVRHIASTVQLAVTRLRKTEPPTAVRGKGHSEPSTPSTSDEQLTQWRPAYDVVWLFGLPFSDLSYDGAVDQIRSMVTRNASHQVVIANAHTLNLAYADATYRRLLKHASLVLRDGVGVELAAALRGNRLAHNFVGTDFVPRLLTSLADLRPRVFLYGAAPGSAEAAAGVLSERTPGIRIVGVENGYAYSGEVVRRVSTVCPDLLLVALGNPLQEQWIAKHLCELNTRVAIGVGALFDYLAGIVPRAPGWVRRMRCEWVFRLGVEPRRLWRRYLIGNPQFLWRATTTGRRGIS